MSVYSVSRVTDVSVYSVSRVTDVSVYSVSRVTDEEHERGLKRVIYRDTEIDNTINGL